MNIPVHWWWLIVATLIALAFLARHKVEAKSVKVCATVTLPAPGKCITRRIHGYKVRVCNK
jgi:hypothetical protein